MQGNLRRGQNVGPAGRPNERMDRRRSHIYRICARQERHRYAQPSAPNGGSRLYRNSELITQRDALSGRWTLPLSWPGHVAGVGSGGTDG